MLIIEEKTLGKDFGSQVKSGVHQQQVFYSNTSRGHGQGQGHGGQYNG